MTNYYRTKHMADALLGSIVSALKESKREARVSKLVLEVTNKYAVSEKAIERRLEYIEDADDEMLIQDGVIKWQ